MTSRKVARKTMAYYRAAHGIEPPFTVLVDGNFLHAALLRRLDPRDRCAETLGARAFLTVTQCVFDELRGLGEAVAGTRIAAKRLKRIPCSHSPISPSQCISKHIKVGTCVATQDPTLRKSLIEGAQNPVLYVDANSVLLESLPLHVREKVNWEGERLAGLMKHERRALAEAKRGTSTKRKTGKKKPKAPNPLSCLPKQRHTSARPTRKIRSRHRTRKQKRASKTADIAVNCE